MYLEPGETQEASIVIQLEDFYRYDTEKNADCSMAACTPSWLVHLVKTFV